MKDYNKPKFELSYIEIADVILQSITINNENLDMGYDVDAIF